MKRWAARWPKLSVCGGLLIVRLHSDGTNLPGVFPRVPYIINLKSRPDDYFYLLSPPGNLSKDTGKLVGPAGCGGNSDTNLFLVA